MKIRNFIQNNKLIFVAFLLPVLLVVLAFAVNGIYPFGENQIAVIDMYHQYVPFLGELQYKLQEGGTLFYTWNGAAGSNFWNLLAYYGASPLNLILALFPKSMIMEGITFILLIKIGLAGSFMAIYLRYIHKGCNLMTVAFATLYALCSYVMGYYWCIMWLDAVMLLPLCILGLNKIIENGKALLYTVALALTIFINYYVAIMVCIFILCYYPILYFIKVKNGGIRKCVVTTGKAVGYSFLALAISAVMLLPTYLSMQSTYYISAQMPENWLFYNDVLDLFNQLLPNSELTYLEGLPNVYCGLIIVMLLVFYMINNTITLREKLLNGGLLLFLFMSLNINKIDFIWHGLHMPNQLPYRYSFVISFILIGMAYKAFMRIDETKLKSMWAVLAAGIFYYLLAQKLFKQDVDDINLFFYGGIVWLVLYSTVMIVYKKGRIERKSFVLLIIVIIVAEMATNTCTSFNKVGNTLRTSYFENSRDVCELAEYTKKEFARTEIDDGNILNSPALYHYRGVSQFSSSLNANTTAFMERIGMEGEPGKNRFNYNLTNPVSNSILNVKYIIAKNLPMKDPDFDLIKKSGNSRLYENRYPLAMGYMTGDEIRTWKYEQENPFDVLNDYVRAATANEYAGVFSDAGAPVIIAENIEPNFEGDGIISQALINENIASKTILEYTADKTQKYYVFVESDNAEKITVSKGTKESEIDIMNDSGSIVNVGTIEEGQTFSITIDYNKGEIGSIISHVCTMDEDVWNDVYDILSRDMMTVTESGDTYIKGKVTVEEDGVFVTSVPYENGWSLKVDGQKKEISELVGGSLISTPLDAGEHEIELKFRPPGILAGSALSLLAILLLVLLQLPAKKKRDDDRARDDDEKRDGESVPPLDDEISENEGDGI